MELKWITREMASAAYSRSMYDHGGAPGVRDEAALDCALARPRELAAGGEQDIFVLAACSAHGLINNRPFVDGNKRTTFLCTYVFLGINGIELDADEAEAAAITLDLHTGLASEEDLALWLRANSRNRLSARPC